jgi:hypothetical protein
MKKNYYSAYNPSNFDLQMVCNLLFNVNSQVEYSELPWMNKNEEKTFMLESELNQESELFKKEAFENLSFEAKEVISIILNSPDEILQLICTSKFGMYSKRLLIKYLHKNKGWENKKIEKTFREITYYVNAL